MSASYFLIVCSDFATVPKPDPAAPAKGDPEGDGAGAAGEQGATASRGGQRERAAAE